MIIPTCKVIKRKKKKLPGIYWFSYSVISKNANVISDAEHQKQFFSYIFSIDILEMLCRHIEHWTAEKSNFWPITLSWSMIKKMKLFYQGIQLHKGNLTQNIFLIFAIVKKIKWMISIFKKSKTENKKFINKLVNVTGKIYTWEIAIEF